CSYFVTHMDTVECRYRTMTIALGDGSINNAPPWTPCPLYADNDSTRSDLFGSLSKLTGRKASAILRFTRSVKVTVGFRYFIKRMAFLLVNGLVFNAATRTPYPRHADNNWMRLALFGTLLKQTGRKTFVT